MFTQNSKLKSLGIHGFGLRPGMTCCKCSVDCYAAKGTYRVFDYVVSARWDDNLRLTKSCKFTTEVATYLWKHPKIKYVRIHPEGDFYDQEYLDKWKHVSWLCPDVTFYCYTKRHDLDWRKRPINFIKLQSLGGEFDSLIKQDEPIVKIFNTKRELEEHGYLDCTDSDLLAISYKSSLIGLVKH